jgi:hypothetical protein
MSVYLGDFNPGDTVRFLWNTNDSSGASITRATNGTISVYQNGNTTQTTTGVTDTEDFDGLTGVHLVAVDTSADGTFYAAGRDIAIVLSGATIDGQTVNAVLAHFSIHARAALRPTTAGRTLDVSSGGEAGIDWANVGSPTTALNLSATNIDTDQVVASVSGAVGSVTTVTDKTGYSLSSGGVQAVWDALTSALTTSGSIGKLLVDNINATISSRLASASYTAPSNSAIAAIQTKTDNLPASPAAVGDIPTAVENADALLTRNWASVTGEASRSVLNALRLLRNKWSTSGSTLVVTKENDSTIAWTATLSTDSAADPITGSDPA